MTVFAAMILAAAIPAAEPPAPAEAPAPVPAEAAAPAAPAAPAAAPAPATNAVEAVDAGKAAEAGKADKDQGKKPERRKVTIQITSDQADYDHKDGVALFDGHVRVDGGEFLLESDQGYVFMEGTNDVKCIVARGNVNITRTEPPVVGTCAEAAFSKASGRIVMKGDGNAPAKLVTRAQEKSGGKGGASGFKGGALEGRQITFWLDSEQAVVDGSTVTIEAEQKVGEKGKDDWKKRILGK